MTPPNEFLAALHILVGHANAASRHAEQLASDLRNVKSATRHLEQLATVPTPKAGQE